MLDDDQSAMFDFELIGISCHLKDYRLAWALNKSLGFAFEKSKDLELKVASGVSKHSIFCFETEENVIFTLIKNRSTAYLAKDVPHADFFIKIEGDFFEKDDLVERLKETKGVLVVFSLDVNRMKSKENFIF